MSDLDENYNYLVNVVLPPLGVSKSDFSDLKKNMKEGKKYFICTKKLAREHYALRIDFKFERNAARSNDLKYYLNEIRAILRPEEGMPQLKVFELFRQKGKSIEEMELEMKRLHLLNSFQKKSLPEVTSKLLNIGNDTNNQKIGKRKSI